MKKRDRQAGSTVPPWWQHRLPDLRGNGCGGVVIQINHRGRRGKTGPRRKARGKRAETGARERMGGLDQGGHGNDSGGVLPRRRYGGTEAIGPTMSEQSAAHIRMGCRSLSGRRRCWGGVPGASPRALTLWAYSPGGTALAAWRSLIRLRQCYGATNSGEFRADPDEVAFTRSSL